MQKQLRQAFAAATTGVRLDPKDGIQAADAFIKSTPASFRSALKTYDQDTQKLFDQAQKIRETRQKQLEEFEATGRVGGRKLSREKFDRRSEAQFLESKALETAGRIRDAGRAFIEAQRVFKRDVEDKFQKGSKLTDLQTKKLNAYSEAATNYQKALREFEPFRKGASFFDSVLGKDVGTKRLTELQGLDNLVRGLGKTAATTSKHLDTHGNALRENQKAQKSYESQVKKTTAADRAANEARLAGIQIQQKLRPQLRELNRLSRFTPLGEEGIGDSRRQLESLRQRFRAEAARASRAERTAKDSGASPEAVARLSTQTERLNRIQQRATDQLSRLRAESGRADKALAKTAEAKKAVAEASSQFNQRIGQSSLLIRQFFRYALGYGALYQALTAFNALNRSVLELDRSLFSIRAIADATNDEMVSISGAIKRVAIETKFTTTEVALAARVLSQAGVSAAELPTALEAVSKFAAGTETEIKTAADLVSTMRNVFTELDDLDITNQLTKAINISKLTGEDLRTILGISAQVAKQYNLTSEQYLSAVTTLRNAGLKASTTATGLRQGLIELFSPDSKTTKALVKRYQDLGENLTGKDVRDRFFGFTQELNPILAAARELSRLGLTGAGRKTLTRGFDVRATNALTALVNGLQELETAEARLASGNQVFKASDTQLQSLANSIDNLGAAFTVLAADIGEGPVRALEDLADGATESIQRLNDLSISAKAFGNVGAEQIATSGIAGAIAGAALGRTPFARFAGGVVGGGVGAFVGAQSLEDSAQGEDSLIDPNTLAGAVGLLGILSLFGRGGILGKAFRGKGDKSYADSIATGVSAFAGVLDKIGGVIGKITKIGLPRILGGLTGIGLALGAAYALVEFALSEQENENTKLKRRQDALKARRTNLEKERQKLASEEAARDPFRPTEQIPGGELFRSQQGGVARAIEEGVREAENYGLLLADVFGDVNDQTRERIELLLTQFRTGENFQKGTAQYKALVKQIVDLGIVTEEYFKENENLIVSLANQYVGNTSRIQGIQQEFKRLLEQASGIDPEERNARQNAIIATFQSESEELALAATSLTRDSVEPSLELFQSYIAFTAEFSRNQKELLKTQDRVQKLQAGNLQANVSQVENILAQAVNEKEAAVLGQVLKRELLKLGDLTNESIQRLIEQTEEIRSAVQADLAAQDRLIQRGTLPDVDESSLDPVLRAQRQRYLSNNPVVVPSGARERFSGDLSQLDVVLEQLFKLQEEQQQLIEKENEKLFFNLDSALKALAKFTAEELGKVLSDPKKRRLVERTGLPELAKGGTAAQSFLESNIITGQGGRQQLTADAEDIINLVSSQTAEAAESPDDDKNFRAPVYIPDPEILRKIFELDQQIADAKERNLKILTEEIEDNPLLKKRDLEIRLKDEELALQRQFLKELEASIAHSTEPEKRRQEVDKQRLAVVKLEIARIKAEEDAEKARQSALRDYTEKLLANRKKRADLEEDQLKAEQDISIKAGLSNNLPALSQALFEVRKEQLEIERDRLKLTEQDVQLADDLYQFKLSQLEVERRTQDLQNRQQALAERERFAISSTRGDAEEQGRRAFVEAAGFGNTSTENDRQRLQELGVQLAAAFERRRNVGQSLGEAQNPEEIRELSRQYAEATVQVGALAGEFRRLSDELNFNYLSFAEFREVWQSSASDVAGAIQDSITQWYQEAPRTIENFVKFLGDGIEVGLRNVFQKFGERALENVVQRGMDEVLGFIDTGFVDREKLADTVNISSDRVLFTPGGIEREGGNPIITEEIAGQGLPVAPEDTSSVTTEGQEGEEEETSGTSPEVAQAIVGLTQSTDRQIAQMAVNHLFDKAKAVDDKIQAVSIQTALGANTIALQANTGALYSSGAAKAVPSPFHKGGVIKGPPGRDNIPGVAVGKGGKIQPIAVEAGEGILTKRAVDFFGGEKFVESLNKLGVQRFNVGGVVGNTQTAGSRITQAVQSVAAPQVINKTKMVNLIDQDMLLDAMRGEEGERVTLNHVQRNTLGLSTYK